MCSNPAGLPPLGPTCQCGAAGRCAAPPGCRRGRGRRAGTGRRWRTSGRPAGREEEREGRRGERKGAVSAPRVAAQAGRLDTQAAPLQAGGPPNLAPSRATHPRPQARRCAGRRPPGGAARRAPPARAAAGLLCTEASRAGPRTPTPPCRQGGARSRSGGRCCSTRTCGRWATEAGGSSLATVAACSLAAARQPHPPTHLRQGSCHTSVHSSLSRPSSCSSCSAVSSARPAAAALPACGGEGTGGAAPLGPRGAAQCTRLHGHSGPCSAGPPAARS